MSFYEMQKKASKIRQAKVEETVKKINKLIKHPGTKNRFISDFPKVADYLKVKFSDVDISNVPIYLVDSSAMESIGFAHVGGFYFEHLHLIVVKKKLSKIVKHKKKFDRLLSLHIKLNVDIEDVVVHESIHAISAASNRPNSKYRFDEEEFVYTNSVDFYLQKGMSTEDIVNGNFLPFCVNDIVTDRDSFLAILSKYAKEVGVELPDTSFSSSIDKFINYHAKGIVPMVIKAGQDMGYHMIALYNQYSRGDVAPPSYSDEEIKMRPIIMDDDW